MAEYRGLGLHDLRFLPSGRAWVCGDEEAGKSGQMAIGRVIDTSASNLVPVAESSRVTDHGRARKLRHVGQETGDQLPSPHG